MLTHIGKGILWVLAFVVIVVFMDTFLIILGTITYYIQDFLGLPVSPPPWGE